MRGYQQPLSTVAEVRAQRPRVGSLDRSTAASATVLRRMWLFLSVLRYTPSRTRDVAPGVFVATPAPGVHGCTAPP